jgi:5-methylcytosine-specific restriction endonuclease McrA
MSFMACKKGRVKLTVDQDRQLFVDSAGTCLLCQTPLFGTSPRGRSIPVAERAHIVAHSPVGPRGSETKGSSTVDDLTNLVLLCPTCHIKVDKEPAEYPTEMLFGLKAKRAAAVARVGGVIVYATRADARTAVEEILRQNRETFTKYGPDSDNGSLPTLEAAAKWRDLVLTEVVPRNELLVSIVQVNKDLASEADRLAAEHLRAHTRDLAAKHNGDPLLAPSQKFPKAAENIFSGSDDQ